MQIHVTIRDINETDSRVEFECICGRGTALWEGPFPAIGDGRYVELEISKAPIPGTEFVETSDPVGIRHVDGGTFLVGDVSVSTAHGWDCFRVGPCEVEFEVSGEWPVFGRRYRVLTPNMTLYDCNY